MRKRLFRGVKWLAGIFAVTVASVLLLLWAQHRTPLDLPALTGRFPVGRLSFDWTDEHRIDPLAPEKGVKRELTVWIWYPAKPKAPVRRAPYMPPAWRAALMQHQGTVFENFLARDPAIIHGHSLENADIATDQPAYPVILFKPGIGALTLDYSTLCEDLASHGYIVVASDSPYSTFVVVYTDGQRPLTGHAVRPV